MAVIGCKPSSWDDQHQRCVTDYFVLAFVYHLQLAHLCCFCRSAMSTGAQCMYHWHRGWRILREKIRQRTKLLGVLDTPAVRKTRPALSRPLRIGWRGKGQCLRIRRRRRRCRQRAAERRRFVRIDDNDEEEEEAVPSLVRRPHSRPDSRPTTTDRVAGDLLRLVLQSRGHRCRLAGRGGGSPRPTVAQTCKCSTYAFRRFF